MHSFPFWMTIGFLAGVVYASLFEWLLHRYFMHRPVGKFDYAFRAHALVHHQIFKADHTYHVIHEKDKHIIPMAWWNGPVLIFCGIMPFILVSWLLGTWAIVLGALVASASYYGAY